MSALHFYERLGLIASTRSSGNQRRYPRDVLRRVSLISVAKRLGTPLADVQSAFEHLPSDRPPSQARWERALRQWQTVLGQRRQVIERLERELTGYIGCGCLSLRACRLLNLDDVLAGSGAGARRLEPEDG